MSGWKSMETKMSLLLFPLLFSLGKLSEKDFYRLLKTIVLIVAILPVIGFFNQWGLYQTQGDSGFLYNDNLVSIFNKQAVYYALYCNTALIFLIYLIEKRKVKTTFEKVIAVLVLFLLIASMYLLASRTSMVIMVGILLSYLIWLVTQRLSKIQGVLFILGGLIMISAFVVSFPKVLNRFQSITNVEYRFDNPNPINHFNGEIKEENWNGLNTRLALWTCAIEKIKEKPIIGYGIGDVQAALVDKYKEKNFILALQSNYNTHNQFLDILMASGLFGFIVVLVFFILLIRNCISNKNWLFFGFLLLLIISGMTENILNRNQGVVFLALILSLLAFRTQKS